MNGGTFRLLTLLALSGSSFGATIAQGDCFVCLTREEAIAAADSALGGQDAVRTVRIWKAAWAVSRSEADTLRREVIKWNGALDAEILAAQKEREAGMILQEALRKSEARRKRAKVWTWIGVGGGLVAGILIAK